MNIELKDLHQGSELEPNQNFIVLICDIDDIKGSIKQNKQKVTKDQLKRIYEYAKRKMTDSVMDQFWYSIDAMIDNILLDDKLKRDLK